MNRPKIMMGLKAASAAAVMVGASLALPAASAYAGTGPSGRCDATWHQGYTAQGFYAECIVSSGIGGETDPWNFRVRIVCSRAGRPDVTVYGGYSDWYSSANCASGYDAGSATIQWVEF